LPDQRQSRLRCQIVGQAFDLEVGQAAAGNSMPPLSQAIPPASPTGCG
jgi:hypothetical protein